MTLKSRPHVNMFQVFVRCAHIGRTRDLEAHQQASRIEKNLVRASVTISDKYEIAVHRENAHRKYQSFDFAPYNQISRQYGNGFVTNICFVQVQRRVESALRSPQPDPQSLQSPFGKAFVLGDLIVIFMNRWYKICFSKQSRFYHLCFMMLATPKFDLLEAKHILTHGMGSRHTLKTLCFGSNWIFFCSTKLSRRKERPGVRPSWSNGKDKQ